MRVPRLIDLEVSLTDENRPKRHTINNAYFSRDSLKSI